MSHEDCREDCRPRPVVPWHLGVNRVFRAETAMVDIDKRYNKGCLEIDMLILLISKTQNTFASWVFWCLGNGCGEAFLLYYCMISVLSRKICLLALVLYWSCTFLGSRVLPLCFVISHQLSVGSKKKSSFTIKLLIFLSIGLRGVFFMVFPMVFPVFVHEFSHDVLIPWCSNSASRNMAWWEALHWSKGMKAMSWHLDLVMSCRWVWNIPKFSLSTVLQCFTRT